MKYKKIDNNNFEREDGKCAYFCYTSPKWKLVKVFYDDNGEEKRLIVLKEQLTREEAIELMRKKIKEEKQ